MNLHRGFFANWEREKHLVGGVGLSNEKKLP